VDGEVGLDEVGMCEMEGVAVGLPDGGPLGAVLMVGCVEGPDEGQDEGNKQVTSIGQHKSLCCMYSSKHIVLNMTSLLLLLLLVLVLLVGVLVLEPLELLLLPPWYEKQNNAICT